MIKNLRVFTGRVLFWLSWPLLRVVLHGSNRTRVLIEAEDCVLMLQGWHDGTTWSLPGGGIHKKETPAYSAIREVAEETSIKLQQSQLVDLGEDTYDKNGLKFKIQRYGCKLPTQPPIKKQLAEVISLEWLPLSTIKQSTVGDTTWRQVLAWKTHR